MRPTFLLNTEMQLVSCLAPKTQAHALIIGCVLEFTQAYETPWGIIPRGARGFVENVDEDDGLVTLFMEGSIPALWEWQHKLVLMPFLTDDVLPAVRLTTRTIRLVNADPNAARTGTG